MTERSGGELVCEAFEAEGVTHLFSLSGGHINPVYAGCARAGIRIIDTRHEEGALFMACGWTETTRQVGAVAVTAGPGVANVVSGLVRAAAANCPVVVIGGDVTTGHHDRGAPQEIDAVACTAPIAKWTKRVVDVDRIPEYVSTAIRIAMSPPTGPTVVIIPVDVLFSTTSQAEALPAARTRTAARPSADPALIAEAARLLKRAKRPVALAGRGCWWSGVTTELQDFLETAGLPLYTGFLSRAFVPEDHPLSFGVAAPLLGTTSAVGLGEADVVLAAGIRFDHNVGYGQPPLFAPDAKVIHIDVDPATIGRNRPVELGIVSDPAAALRQLREQFADFTVPRKWRSWVSKLNRERKAVAKEVEPLLNSDDTPIHPARLAKEVRDFLPRDATIASDGGDVHWWALPLFRAYLPGHYLKCSAETAGLGAGVPMAMAAKLARPDQVALAFVGDGAFGFNAMEMDTAVRHEIPVVCVVANDGWWGMIRQGQLDAYGPEGVTGVHLGVQRYDRMVEALGGHGEFVTDPEQIRPALERAVDSGRPACVNVHVQGLKSSGTTWFGNMA